MLTRGHGFLRGLDEVVQLDVAGHDAGSHRKKEEQVLPEEPSWT